MQHRFDFQHSKAKVSVLVPIHTILHHVNKEKVMGSAFMLQEVQQ